MKKKNFNIIIAGYGGQGILTLADIIARAAFVEGYDVKQAELHGLAQRGGSLQIHVRFGNKVFSSLVSKGQADLIIALEVLEALRACYFSNKNTRFLINKKIFRIEEDLNKVLEKVKRHGKVNLIEADKIVQEMTGEITYVNTFILGYLIAKKLLPLKKETVWKTLKEKIRHVFLEDNKKVFDRVFEI